jgi:hypothetical protein
VRGEAVRVCVWMRGSVHGFRSCRYPFTVVRLLVTGGSAEIIEVALTSTHHT